MSRRKRVIAVIVVLALATGLFFGYRVYTGAENETIQATGTIEATTVELNARASGTIKVLSVNAGDSVTRGQLVVEISRNDLVAQRERDALGVVKAESQLADLVSGARSQEKDEAAASVEIARASYENALTNFNRAEGLYQDGAIPRAEYDRVQTAKEQAESQLKMAQSKYSLVESGSRPQQIEAARAEVERSKAVLKATEAMLEDLKVFVPIDGEVLTRNYEAGEYVQMGASLATVANLEDLWIKVYIPTDDLPRVKMGQKVKFSVSGISDIFNGTVEEISSKGEFTPKTIQTKKERTNVVYGVKIGIDEHEGILKPGMPADVIFE